MSDATMLPEPAAAYTQTTAPDAACNGAAVRAAPAREPWLQLCLTEGLGPVRMLRLLRRFGLPEQILEQTAAKLESVIGGRLAARLLSPDPARDTRVMQALEWLDSSRSHHLIALGDPDYPARWLDLADPPPCVYLLGRPEQLGRSALAVVGSRHASPSGMRTAREFSQAMASAGWSVVSGLALGIDAAAHHGALDVQGNTLAFVGTGLDRIYPRQHRALAEQISQHGALISEFALGTQPLRANFPRRNRLIAAQAAGVLVVEAARQSGSLITAREAAQIGREVFAIPGSIHSPLSRGCHWLIKQGAKLVESADDLIEELPAAFPDTGSGSKPLGRPAGLATNTLQAAHNEAPAEPGLSAIAQQVLAGLGWDPQGIDSLCEALSLGPAKLQPGLLELELAGRCERLTDGRFVLRSADTGSRSRLATRRARPV